MDRRALLGTAMALAVTRTARAGDDPVLALIGALEERNGGRLGVAAVDTGSGRRIAYRADERFRMCSTFKLLLVGQVLSRIDRHIDRPDRWLKYGPSDLLSHSPVTSAHVGQGGMRLDELCAAAIEHSDNTSANLLLSVVGGPPAVTAYARGLGDGVTRLDRIELELNRGAPDDPRDTTAPDAMIGDMEKVLLGSVLSAASRQALISWLVAAMPGLNRIRKGVPADWRGGDKAGTGDNWTNDLAILWPPARKPILVATYFENSTAPFDQREAVLASVGRIVAATF